MKNWSLIILTFAMIGIFSSCEKDESNTPETSNISNEEVVEIVAAALMSQSEGVSSDASEAAQVATNYSDENANIPSCGESYDSTFLRNIDNAFITTAYTLDYAWTLNCNNFNIPSSLDWSSQKSGTYETNRMESDDSSTTTLNVSNLITGSNFLMNGTFNRTGSQISKVGNMNTFTSSIHCDLVDLTVGKQSRQIESGIATFFITAQISDGDPFAIEGSITFLGNGAATILVNGEIFEIDLS